MICVLCRSFYSAVFFLIINALVMVVTCSPVSAEESIQPFFEDFPLPQSLRLCNEPVPLEKPSVREMLEREFIISVWDQAQVFMWLKRAGRYFAYIEKQLAEAGLPDDLKYLAVAESALRTHVHSNAGAVGPWQFMKNTARHNGLRKNRLTDERYHFENSTEAALKYLKRLHEKFGSWTLAMAAYNCGDARVKRAIKQQKVNDYYRLNLPLETERYIFRIAAAKIIMENPKRYGYNLSSESIYKPIECDTVPVKISLPLHITDVAQALETDFKIIRELNPQFTDYYLPTGRYELKVPPGLGDKAAEVVQQMNLTAARRMKKASGNTYTVQSGDTLSHIALRTGVSVDTLKQLNGLSRSVIIKGQRLRLRP
jgi:membrane-bound lytic murein transglycosylase D